jgi:hypothetical protein
MSDLICPVCGKAIDPAGYGVASNPERDAPDQPWRASWVPFIEDLRGSPTRLVHARCFVEERGLDDLLDAVHRNDERMRGAGW